MKNSRQLIDMTLSFLSIVDFKVYQCDSLANLVFSLFHNQFVLFCNLDALVNLSAPVT